MRPRALVTGATGMLGSYIVEELVSEGWCVVALVRDVERGRWLTTLGAALVPGDLEDRSSLIAAAGGCDAVFHAAAAIGAGGSMRRFRRSNVDGTGNVVEAAARAGARLVHVSSTSVFGSARYREEPTDESVPLPELPEHDAYGRSKQEAERIVLEAHRRGRAWTTVVRPPLMYGVRDRQLMPRIGPVFERGFFPLIDGGRATLSLVYAGNVARGAVLAGSSSAAGGRVYHLTNDGAVDAAMLVRCAREGLGIRVRAPEVPKWIGRTGFSALACALRIAGREDLARHAPGTFAMLTRPNPFTSRRARDELGWNPATSPQVRLAEAFRWWKEASANEHGGRG